MMKHPYRSLPPRQGLYDPAHEHDSCGTGFVGVRQETLETYAQL